LVGAINDGQICEKFSHFIVAWIWHIGLLINTILRISDRLDGSTDNKEAGASEDRSQVLPGNERKRMIQNTISENDAQRFVDYFSDAYALNYNWCESIKHLAKEVDSVARK